MIKNRYSFDLLFRHSNQTAIDTRRVLAQPMREARRLFTFLSQHFDSIQEEPTSHSRNVRLALTARFINHLFAELTLIERGLILDAFNCSRSALETTGLYWLVVKDPSSAALYDEVCSPKPVEVRKKLEALGVNIDPLRELYSFQSGVAHVGNKTDHLQIDWERQKSGRLLVGGGPNEVVQRAMLVGLVKSVFRFVKMDDQYAVPDLDQILPEL